jgi:hypothetical protein
VRGSGGGFIWGTDLEFGLIEENHDKIQWGYAVPQPEFEWEILGYKWEASSIQRTFRYTVFEELMVVGIIYYTISA